MSSRKEKNKTEKENSKEKETNYGFLKTLLSLVFILALIWVGYSLLWDTSTKATANGTENHNDSTESKELSEDFIKAVVQIHDSTDNYIMVSDTKDLNIALDDEAGKGPKRIFSGRRINIAVTGVDTRMGANTKHADANHVLSLLLDSGKIEIYSIPRDTYADCGYDDTTGLNKLTVLRAGMGREAYLKEVAKITKLDKIHYFVEFGFSQAMGILEFLGYKNASGTLQVLRSRRGLGGDDYQRVYNQAQFIRQAVLQQFSRFDGTLGSILMRGGLTLAETNLTYDISSGLYETMKSKGFPRNSSDVTIYIRPAMPIKFKVYDFTKEETMDELRKRIEGFNQHRLVEYEEQLSPQVDVARKLDNLLNRAAADTAKNPTQAINKLRLYFEQRAWFQVPDVVRRDSIRSRFSNILANSYRKKKQFDKADEVIQVIEHERNIFNKKEN